jgi:hypothetical protein
MLEKPKQKVLADVPTRHCGTDLLREFLFSGGKPGEFGKYVAKRKTAA